MRCDYACGSAEHRLSRRRFLGAAAGLGAGFGLSQLLTPAASARLEAGEKKVLVLWLLGGLSQLESWDPKPHTPNGGPFRAIETSVPGIQICELLPRTARQMHHLTILRGLNTSKETGGDHARGQFLMLTGREQKPGQEYPQLGSVMSRFLASDSDPLPGYIHVTPGGGGFNGKEAAFLGPKYGALYVGPGKGIANAERPEAVSESADQARNAFRCRLDDRFASRRRTAETEAYTTTYDQARLLMERREVFDVDREPEPIRERYGRHDFGRQCLLARRLLEGGATYVQVTHSNYDTHNENFTFHLEQLGEFDQGFANLMEDLAASGLLDHTLVVVMSEFGRTPGINYLYGRDHWDKCWSVALGGTGLKRGLVHGATDENGTEVVDGQVGAGHLFHTYLRAVGLDPSFDFEANGRPIQLAEPSARAIVDVLA